MRKWVLDKTMLTSVKICITLASDFIFHLRIALTGDGAVMCAQLCS